MILFFKTYKKSFAFLFIGFIVFLVLDTQERKSCERENNYQLIAYFSSIEGINKNSEVRIAGTKAGSVCDISIQKNLQIKVVMLLDDNIELPVDSAFLIVSNQIGSSKYIKINPGGSFDVFANGDEVEYVQNAVSVTNILKNIIHVAEKKITQKRENQ